MRAEQCVHFNPFMPNEISQRYLLEQSISVLGMLGGIFHFYSNFYRKFCKQTVENLSRCHVLQTVENLIIRHVLWRLIWICTICLCPTKRTLGLYGLTTEGIEAIKLFSC